MWPGAGANALGSNESFLGNLHLEVEAPSASTGSRSDGTLRWRVGILTYLVFSRRDLDGTLCFHVGILVPPPGILVSPVFSRRDLGLSRTKYIILMGVQWGKIPPKPREKANLLSLSGGTGGHCSIPHRAPSGRCCLG